MPTWNIICLFRVYIYYAGSRSKEKNIYKVYIISTGLVQIMFIFKGENWVEQFLTGQIAHLFPFTKFLAGLLLAMLRIDRNKIEKNKFENYSNVWLIWLIWPLISAVNYNLSSFLIMG